MRAADALMESLKAEGVEDIFGIPGDGINGVIEALRTRQDKIRFIQVRHEESAAFWLEAVGGRPPALASWRPPSVGALDPPTREEAGASRAQAA